MSVQLGYRFAHVLRRMLPIAMFLLQRDGQFLNGHDLFLKRVGSTYHAFLESAEKECRNKCLEDLQSTTRYVTWSLHTKSRASLKSMLNRVRLRPCQHCDMQHSRSHSDDQSEIQRLSACQLGGCKIEGGETSAGHTEHSSGWGGDTWADTGPDTMSMPSR